MEPTIAFTSEDLARMEKLGITAKEVERQLALLTSPPPYQKLLRPACPADGIRVLDNEEMQVLTELYEAESASRVCSKFVPASGAATRMFKFLHSLDTGEGLNSGGRARPESSATEGEAEIHLFMDRIRHFAFYEELKSVLSQGGLNLEQPADKEELALIASTLLQEPGLGYAHAPKGLVLFHAYEHGPRTAFEEHLVEAAHYIADENRKCRLHFTVSGEHAHHFESLWNKIRPHYEKRYQVTYDVSFSLQKRSTDTIALNADNTPFRLNDGRLLFRPGGHGALIENLDDLQGDIIFIKNIDNVVHDRLKPITYLWKKILGGYLLRIQRKVWNYVQRLSTEQVGAAFLDQVMAFAEDELLMASPEGWEEMSAESKAMVLMERLDRPIRICGMVENKGEPGGGPFWARDHRGNQSLQIVEKAQVDPHSDDQQAILASSTHFNPVDLVCGVRDWQHRPFGLSNYVDDGAVVMAEKSEGGTPLRALERPGLWNGAMARWITLFVEVPGVTFHPVKTVTDLLRDGHQPE